MKKNKKNLIEKIISAKRESKNIEFKEQLDVENSGEWLEIIKDIVAMANSGGGVIAIGLKNDGTPNGYNCTALLNYDLAKLSDKIFKYTGSTFSEIEIESITKGRKEFACLIIGEVLKPLVFNTVGNYTNSASKPVTVFSKGSLYFRHGAKSEPCSSDDIEDVIERNIKHAKKFWNEGIKKITSAPTDSQLAVIPRGVSFSTSSDAIPVRITDNVDAKPIGILDPNDTHPLRCKDATASIKLKTGISVSPTFILWVRKEYGIDSNKALFYKPTHGSPLYSHAFVDFMCDKIGKDKNFVQKIKAKYTKH